MLIQDEHYITLTYSFEKVSDLTTYSLKGPTKTSEINLLTEIMYADS